MFEGYTWGESDCEELVGLLIGFSQRYIDNPPINIISRLSEFSQSLFHRVVVIMFYNRL